MKFASLAASSYATFADSPTWWNGIKSGMIMLKELSDDQEVWAYDYFDDDDGWIEPFNRDFNGAFLKLLTGYGHSDIKTSSDNLIVRLHDVDGITFGYILNVRAMIKVDKIYCRAEQRMAARELLQKLLWKQYGDQSLVMRRSDRSNAMNSDEDRVVLEVDQVYKSMSSKRATEYATYLKRCIDAGVHRSVMLYGPPGTGKSTMAKTIVESLNLRSFRIRVGDAGGIDTNTLFESVNIFQPEAIIFDDFDRAHNQENLLETLEHFHNKVKLIIATVNRRDSLDEALLRPGRFDELECIRVMDEDVVKKVLGEENHDVLETLKEWPIAFIQEYVKRTAFMSKEESLQSVEELAERVDRLSEFDEEDPNQRVMRRLTNNAKPGSLLAAKMKKASLNAAMGDENEPLPVGVSGTEEIPPDVMNWIIDHAKALMMDETGVEPTLFAKDANDEYQRERAVAAIGDSRLDQKLTKALSRHTRGNTVKVYKLGDLRRSRTDGVALGGGRLSRRRARRLTNNAKRKR